MVETSPLTESGRSSPADPGARRTAGWRFEERDCPLCGAPSAAAVHLGRRGGPAHRGGLGVETGVVRCPRCHGVYQRPTAVPEGNPYQEHAPDSYFAAHASDEKIRSGEWLADRAAQLLGRQGKMLEIGCGRGELLRGAANRGWQVAGVDMTESFARIASSRFGVEVEVASAEATANLTREWDVVTLAAVLEHLYDPLAVLRRVKAALRPGGLIFIDVPNECSLLTRMGNLCQRLRGRNWAVNLSPTFAPFHVVGFCPGSLKYAIGSIGLEIVALELYKPRSCLATPGRGLQGRLEDAGARVGVALGQVLGMGAGIICWARRPA